MWRITGGLGVVAAVLLTLIAAAAAFPGPFAGFALDDIRRPVYRGNVRTRESKSDTEVQVKSDISVIDGRSKTISSTFAPTTATPIAESLKMVTKQLLQAPSATDMVATDVRTPPKVKSQLKGEINDFVPLGKGEAHPIIIDDTSAYEIITAAPPKPSTPPSTAGLSTWILLSNGEQSTLATKKKNTIQPTVDPKKKPTPPTTLYPEKVIQKNEDENKVGKPGIVKPVVPIRKANITREEPPKASALILQDSKFKNRTPVVVGRIPSINKTDTSNTVKKVTTPAPTTSTTTISKKKTTPPSTKHSLEIVPTTSLLLETDTVETTEETSTTESTSTTTKRTRRPSNKKKKKNKNRRRRPSKPDSDTAESKIEDNSLASKIESERPISTRIYNYLAREVMPSVGVGIVGLVLTAGLAGLFLYPFGGGIARRNYNKTPNPLSSDSHMYYYNSYSPHPEPEVNNAQPEEKIFGQVLSSMNQNSFSPSPPFDSSKYSASNHKYRYDIHDYNVNGYANNNDYSTLPDSVKNGDYQTDSSKYYSMDPVSTHYKLTDNSPQTDSFKSEGNHYPSLTEYTSYTNAASIGTANSYENSADNSKNDTSIGEDKSNKSQPQFSALVGSPSFTNTDFVGSVSLTGSYGAQEVRHRTGALAASDHGPRSLKRTRRDVHDDFTNEIDSTDEKLLRKPSEVPTIKLESTTDIIAGTKEPTTITNDVNTSDNLDTTTESVMNVTSSDGEDNKDVTERPDDGTSLGSDGGFFGFLKRLAQVKLKLGISLLRSTGETFQKYLNIMAKRMETAVRNMDNQYRRSLSNNQWTSISSSGPVRKPKND